MWCVAGKLRFWDTRLAEGFGKRCPPSGHFLMVIWGTSEPDGLTLVLTLCAACFLSPFSESLILMPFASFRLVPGARGWRNPIHLGCQIVTRPDLSLQGAFGDMAHDQYQPSSFCTWSCGLSIFRFLILWCWRSNPELCTHQASVPPLKLYLSPLWSLCYETMNY